MTHSKATRHRHREIVSSSYKKQRLRVLARDNGTCLMCGAQEQVMHVDHIVPRSKGGTHDMDNLQTLCVGCNLKKGDKMAFFERAPYPPILFQPVSTQMSVVFDDFAEKP